ncbi:hypothetical protein D3C78_1846580 [compost metagenome]
MDSAELVHHRFDGLLHRLFIADVGLHEHRTVGTDVGYGLFAGFDVEVENGDAGGFLFDQVVRGGQAQARSAAGDNDDFVLDTHDLSCF